MTVIQSVGKYFFVHSEAIKGQVAVSTMYTVSTGRV